MSKTPEPFTRAELEILADACARALDDGADSVLSAHVSEIQEYLTQQQQSNPSVRQDVYTTSTNLDDSDNDLAAAQARFVKQIYDNNAKGWALVHHTITKDEVGDYLILAIFEDCSG